MTAPEIAVAGDSGHRAAAQRLAADLDLPLGDDPGCPLVLHCTDRGLELVCREKGQPASTVRVDFNAPGTRFRHRQQKKELLLRAMGSAEGTGLTVIDGTGGLGRDSFVLARAGYRVLVFERQPVIARLLADGLERAGRVAQTAPVVQRITLTRRDVLDPLETMAQQDKQVELVYLDPMFPGRRKSARVKKESRVLQLLATQQDDPARLLRAAAAACTRRVVVKRPRTAPPLAEISPSFSLKGKTVRFDIYLQQGKNS